MKAPQSESSDNNGRRLGFACADVCRVAYEETDATLILPSGRLVTWAYGEGAPTVVGGAAGSNLASPVLAYRADGRLWVAWIDVASQRVQAKLGDARGAGGRVADAGAPPLPQPSFIGGLAALPLGQDLLLNAVADQVSPLQAQFVNLVLEPGAVDTGDVPDPKIVTSPGGKLVYPGTVTQPLRARAPGGRQAGPHLGAGLLRQEERHGRPTASCSASRHPARSRSA